jgi:hypothetical protein
MNTSQPRSSHAGGKALAAALSDLRERDAAAIDDVALVSYEAKWQRKLRRLQHVYPGRWRVPGLSDEEVRDILTLRLIEALRAGAFEAADHPCPEKEWGLLIVERELRVLRKSFRLGAISADFDEAPVSIKESSQEEQWLELEANRRRALAQERAEESLSRPQRQWWSALKDSACAGSFFASSAEPNLSAASRLLGKNRSSAQRAYRELQNRFMAELKR